MANALGRDIKEGEVVVMSSRYYQGDLNARLFRCTVGFGMRSFTSGGAIGGEWLDGTGKDRVEGYQIDKAETLAWQADNPQA